jgi:hypothetical protein
MSLKFFKRFNFIYSKKWLNYYLSLYLMPNLIKNKRILDLSRIIVGPYASSVLSGFGC